ncbi:hypothetical protein F8M49_25075 [Rhodococcus zopfii]|uniref:Integrase SAM-like N-terminal domain-containing protein n=1 Tax=Rhodococcus zopfii TaxID=43772 RepID=A0ABU3WVT1_9NOCA|nr:hypothetical protein [Rhodococcus zopfii]
MASKVNLSESTRSRYRSALDVHILPAFKPTPLADLTRERLRRWVASMTEASSAATVRKKRRRPVTDSRPGRRGLEDRVEPCRRPRPATHRPRRTPIPDTAPSRHTRESGRTPRGAGLHARVLRPAVR